MVKEGTAHDPKRTTSSMQRGAGSVMMWACMADNGTGSLIFIDDVMLTLSAHIQPKASEIIGPSFREQIDSDPKHTTNATKEF